MSDNNLDRPEDIEIKGKITEEFSEILTRDALIFVAELERSFRDTRARLLKLRTERQKLINAGKLPDFLEVSKVVRDDKWEVEPIPHDLQDRRVEITGPVERKMMINALNSGANVFMADFEDSTSPTWENVIQGQINCRDAVRKTISFANNEGKTYKLNEQIATLVVRPRGFHLDEKHLVVDGFPVSASIFDFGLYFFHNVKKLLESKSGPYFYLPKLESHLEARLWNDIFVSAENLLAIKIGTIKATVLIETVLAAFEMEEILYELREHAAGLNAGRWDYIFSIIKKFCNNSDVLPDRVQITMKVPFMKSYSQLLVKTCHKRGAHAIGGMSAFIPSRKDEQVNQVAFAKVKEDKEREANEGFDGTWVAHPDLVNVARKEFDSLLNGKVNQKDRQREDVKVIAADLLTFSVSEGVVTENGMRNNISVALQYMSYWLAGTGAVAIHNLMEDAATAEISRSQLWQWIHNKALLNNGTVINIELYKTLLNEEYDLLTKELPPIVLEKLPLAREILNKAVTEKEFVEFITTLCYEYLD